MTIEVGDIKKNGKLFVASHSNFHLTKRAKTGWLCVSIKIKTCNLTIQFYDNVYECSIPLQKNISLINTVKVSFIGARNQSKW